MYKLSIADTQQFLTQHWQKQPVVIKQGFSKFEDPISADELAGLAMEKDIDSRVVANIDNQWSVTHGPFDDYEKFGESNWSLLVQGVNYYLPQAQQLVNPFYFIPQWRLEDLMVSFSTPQGGVGPHTDQYDVFIIQGMGKRRWQVGAKTEQDSFLATDDLQHVDDFDPIIDEVLEAGDILYIPPGFPHQGETLEAALNYSVGFRAPQQSELLSGLADFVLQADKEQQRYQDGDLTTRSHSSDINQNEIAKFKQLVREFVADDELLEQWLGESLSRSTHELDLSAEPLVLLPQQVEHLLKDGQKLTKVNGVRCITMPIKDGQMDFYVEGEQFCCSDALAADIKSILCSESFSWQDYQNCPAPKALLPLLTALIELGFWEF